MGKGLEALKYVEELKLKLQNEDNGVLRRLNLIETELKDYEKKTKLAKEYADVNNVAKRLKALEIIKEKQVDIHNLLQSETVEQYNSYTHWLGYKGNLTKQEFDLLKEVLK